MLINEIIDKSNKNSKLYKDSNIVTETIFVKTDDHLSGKMQQFGESISFKILLS